MYNNQQLEGPYNEVELKILNARKIITDASVFCFQGSNQWVNAEDLSFLDKKNIVDANLKAVLRVSEEEAWVALINKEQFGPFSSLEILKKLHSGQLQYSDYLWRSDLGQWKKISEISNFIPTRSANLSWRTKDLEIQESLPQEILNRKNILQHIETVKHKKWQLLEEILPEAAYAEDVLSVREEILNHQQERFREEFKLIGTKHFDAIDSAAFMNSISAKKTRLKKINMSKQELAFYSLLFIGVLMFSFKMYIIIRRA